MTTTTTASSQAGPVTPDYSQWLPNDLIDKATRVTFLVEAAERRERKASRDRLLALIAYHENMAELTARTTAWCAEAQVRINRVRADHTEKARAAIQELAQLEAGAV